MRTLAAACAGFLAFAIAGFACCGDGPPVGPRPSTPLAEREPAGGPVELLWVGRIDTVAAASEVETALGQVPGVSRVEANRARGSCRIWFRDRRLQTAALIEACARAGHPASPLCLSKLLLPGAGRKGKLPPIETALFAVPGVVDLEIEVEGQDGLARIWHRPGIAGGTLRDVVTRSGAAAQEIARADNLTATRNF